MQHYLVVISVAAGDMHGNPLYANYMMKRDVVWGMPCTASVMQSICHDKHVPQGCNVAAMPGHHKYLPGHSACIVGGLDV